MDDREILARIHTLVDEEDDLHERGVGDTLEPDEQRRLDELEQGLDVCWDLLRQRRARRNAGLDPDEAQVRPVDTVEEYRQ
ncbi:MAG: DUF2630 family protein [Actinomycetota bacterium]|jgi:hypothetical protein|nr:DUF2630 family protein [Euzebyaceae bacterium]MDQ3453221.1 DUF2630 family protein [Actinomycetota bacterium]